MIITKNVLIYKKNIFSFFVLLKTGKKKYLELFTDHDCTLVYKDVVKEILILYICKPA
jgi:hypothetical protein